MPRVIEERELTMDGREETPRERLDRNLSELTGELRVVVTGVQVLFAFLLVVPFDARFARLGSYQRDLYFATLLLSALSAVCVIAPSAQHRILFRRDEKAYLVSRATTQALAGLAFLGMAMCGARSRSWRPASSACSPASSPVPRWRRRSPCCGSRCR